MYDGKVSFPLAVPIKGTLAKKSQQKRQKARLNKSIFDVGFGMLKSAIKYKVEEGGGQFVEVPTKKVKPSQTCPKCGNQEPKTLDKRIHQ